MYHPCSKSYLYEADNVQVLLTVCWRCDVFNLEVIFQVQVVVLCKTALY